MSCECSVSLISYLDTQNYPHKFRKCEVDKNFFAIPGQQHHWCFHLVIYGTRSSSCCPYRVYGALPSSCPPYLSHLQEAKIIHLYDLAFLKNCQKSLLQNAPYG